MSTIKLHIQQKYEDLFEISKELALFRRTLENMSGWDNQWKYSDRKIREYKANIDISAALHMKGNKIPDPYIIEKHKKEIIEVWELDIMFALDKAVFSPIQSLKNALDDFLILTKKLVDLTYDYMVGKDSIEEASYQERKELDMLLGKLYLHVKNLKRRISHYRKGHKKVRSYIDDPIRAMEQHINIFSLCYQNSDRGAKLNHSMSKLLKLSEDTSISPIAYEAIIGRAIMKYNHFLGEYIREFLFYQIPLTNSDISMLTDIKIVI